MKVLTIKQPWATLIMQGDKQFEFRSWQTKYRGENYGWQLEDVHVFNKPIDAKGHLSLWEYDLENEK